MKKRVSETLKFTIIDKDGDDNDNDNNNHIKTMIKMMTIILMSISIMMKIHDGEILKYYILFFLNTKIY